MEALEEYSAFVSSGGHLAFHQPCQYDGSISVSTRFVPHYESFIVVSIVEVMNSEQLLFRGIFPAATHLRRNAVTSSALQLWPLAEDMESETEVEEDARRSDVFDTISNMARNSDTFMSLTNSHTVQTDCVRSHLFLPYFRLCNFLPACMHACMHACLHACMPAF